MAATLRRAPIGHPPAYDDVPLHLTIEKAPWTDPKSTKLLEAAGEIDQDALTVLYDAWSEKFETYRSANSKANLAEWQAAEKALKAKADELAARYFDAPGTRVLADRLEAWRYLESEGYKVSRQTVYNAAKKGKLAVQADGSITESDALAYAAKYLKKVAGKNGKPDKLAEERAAEELALIRTKRERMDFEFAKDRGLYILKSDVRAEIAIKIAALDAYIRHFFRTYLADWIHRVGGNPQKAAMLQELINTELDQAFNEFGRMEDIDVVVVKDAGDPAPADKAEIDGGVFAVETDSKREKPVDGIIGGT